MANLKAGLTGHQPTMTIGRGGPPATPVAHDLRALRDKAHIERIGLRNASKLSAADKDRRRVELNAQIKFLSEEIRKAERC